MKLSTLALLLATTKAAALTVPAFCATAVSYKAYMQANTARQAFRDAAINKITACEKDAITASKETWYSERVEWSMMENKTSGGKMLPDLKTYFTTMSAIGDATGIGNMSCPMKQYYGADITCVKYDRLKGPLEYQLQVYKWADAYQVEMNAACKKVTVAADKTKCYTDGNAALIVLAKAWGTADLAGMTAAKRTEWMTADDKKRILAAAPVIAAGEVGYACKAAAVVAPATAGVRPVCGAANCCMGHKKLPADTTNTGGEFCQLKTATKGAATTTAATASLKGGYMTSVAAVTASYDGACIEGAIRATSAALSVLATAYMMA